MKRLAGGPVHGVALTAYFALAPYVVVSKWAIAAHRQHGPLLQALLVVLAGFWVAFVVQVVRNVVRLRHGATLPLGGTAWVAGVVVAVLTLWPGPGARVPATSRSVAAAVTRPVSPPARPGVPSAPLELSGLPLALAVRQRVERLRRDRDAPAPEDVDELLDQARRVDASLLGRLRYLMADATDGVVQVDLAGETPSAPEAEDDTVVVCVLDASPSPMVAFAREGGCLRVPAHWDDPTIVAHTVGLHRGGRVVCTSEATELVYALAIRAVRHQAVVYLGEPADLEAALVASAVTVSRLDRPPGDLPTSYQGRWHAGGGSTPGAGGVVVELLRADPTVHGLATPFLPALRRHCVEMTAYLALHRHEPVTGDRLRARVLGRPHADASPRTLMNTSTAVRRSLGVDDDGPRLHPVSSSGLYTTHGVRSDVEEFHRLVGEARRLSGTAAIAGLRRALSLVRGEPLASALRGFEWFLAEGHAARLQRDGEWAALALHAAALASGDVELAFWALGQGRLVDPYSDDLADALVRVPRLREFGGDGSRAGQDRAIGPGSAVGVARPLDGLRDQVGQQLGERHDRLDEEMFG